MSRPSLSHSGSNGELRSGIWIAKTPSAPKSDGSVDPPKRRLRVSWHCDAALSWDKLCFIVLALLGLVFYIAQKDEAAIQSAIENAESRVLRSARTALDSSSKDVSLPRAKRSKLARAMGESNLKLHSFKDHYLCGHTANVSVDEVASKSLALAVVTYKAPKSLAHSMKTWYKTGLLDMAEEKFIFINSPSQVSNSVCLRKKNVIIIYIWDMSYFCRKMSIWQTITDSLSLLRQNEEGISWQDQVWHIWSVTGM